MIKVNVLQDKAAHLGISSEVIAATLNGIVGGTNFTQIRDNIYLVDVIGRAKASDRASIEVIRNLQIQSRDGRSFPIAAIASIDYEIEQPIVWRRKRLPTITIKAGISNVVRPATAVAQPQKEMDGLKGEIPPGYSIQTAGAVEESGRPITHCFFFLHSKSLGSASKRQPRRMLANHHRNNN